MNSLIEEKERLELGKKNLEARRAFWQSSAKGKIQNAFGKIVHDSKSINYPFSLYYQTHDESKNEETVQLSPGINKTGVILRLKFPRN